LPRWRVTYSPISGRSAPAPLFATVEWFTEREDAGPHEAPTFNESTDLFFRRAKNDLALEAVHRQGGAKGVLVVSMVDRAELRPNVRLS
jgi:hypothetical protein